ncbi:phage major tail tube protein [Stappia sp. 22II-S9-Z10]|nr:phage major tail tube protein [Stappia sp. 22II-S9-Z10]
MPLEHYPRNIIRNATVYMGAGENASKIGQAKTMQTPNIAIEFEDAKNAGMNMPAPQAMGFTVEDADIAMTALDPDAISMLGQPDQEYLFVAQMRSDNGATQRALYYVRGMLSEIDFDGWEAGKLHEHSYVIKPKYGKFTIDNRELVEWDYFDLTIDGRKVFQSLAALREV